MTSGSGCRAAARPRTWADGWRDGWHAAAACGPGCCKLHTAVGASAFMRSVCRNSYAFTFHGSITAAYAAERVQWADSCNKSARKSREGQIRGRGALARHMWGAWGAWPSMLSCTGRTAQDSWQWHSQGLDARAQPGVEQRLCLHPPFLRAAHVLPLIVAGGHVLLLRPRHRWSL